MNPKWVSLLQAMSGDVRRLDYVDRFTSIPVTLKETVSQHSFWVAFYAMLIHQAVSGDKALLAPILSHALVHDLVESVTGDLVRTFKYSSENLKNAVDEAEVGIVKNFCTEVQELMGLHEELCSHAGDRTYVKAVVKAADFVSLHQYMVREYNRGNAEIKPFLTRMQNDLVMMAQKFDSAQDPRIQSMAGLFFLMSETTTPGPYTT